MSEKTESPNHWILKGENPGIVNFVCEFCNDQWTVVGENIEEVDRHDCPSCGKVSVIANKFLHEYLVENALQPRRKEFEKSLEEGRG